MEDLLTRSYFIPSGELTLTQMANFKEKTIDAGVERSIARAIVQDRSELVASDIRPSIHLPVTFAAGDRWIFPAPAAAVAAAFTVTNWINENLPINTTLAIFGIGVESAAPEVSTILFRSGPGGQGRTIAVVEIEKLYTKLETDGFLSVPITYDAQETIFIQVINRVPIAAGGTILSLRGYVIEPKNQNVS